VDYSISPLGQSEVHAPDQSVNSNNFQIDFFGISASAGIRYQYKLEGADQNWSLPTTQRTVTFANVRPGRYRFLVRTVGADDVASETPAQLFFQILPPIWQRWWFLTLAALLIAGARAGLRALSFSKPHGRADAERRRTRQGASRVGAGLRCDSNSG
jgi:hypothetical protein